MLSNPSSGHSRIVTFYSYKGGVGRSMLLANVGALLSRWDKKVLLIDFDLEAPGLNWFFKEWHTNTRQTGPGLVDMLTEVAQDRIPEWRRYVTTVNLPNKKQIDLMHAGMDDGVYSQRLASLNWETLFTDHHLGDFLESWRYAMLAKDGYDFVLIDSRTGFTDIGGICTIHLLDALVGVVTTTEQSLQGLKAAMLSAAAGHARFPVERERLISLPISSRDESARAYENAIHWRKRFADELGELLWWRPRDISAETVFDWLRIPYETHWSFGEQLPVLQEDVENPKNLSFSYFQVAQLIRTGFDWTEVQKMRVSSVDEKFAQEKSELMVKLDAEKAVVVEEAEAEKARARAEIEAANAKTAISKKSALMVSAVGLLLTVTISVGALFVYQAKKSEAEAARAQAQAELAVQRATAAEHERARVSAQLDESAGILAYGRGQEAFANKDYAEAIKQFSQSIKLNPQFPDVYRVQGMAYDRLAKSGNVTTATERTALMNTSLDQYVKWVNLDPSSSRRIDVAAQAAKLTPNRNDVIFDQATRLLAELRQSPNSRYSDEMVTILNKVRTLAGRAPDAKVASDLITAYGGLAR